MTKVQIMLTDLENGGVDCEMRTNGVANDKSPSNILASFLAKYWEIICTSAQGEYKQALAELSGKPIEAAPLRLVAPDGAGIVAPSDAAPAAA